MSERDKLVHLGDCFVAICAARYLFCASQAGHGNILDIASGSGYGAYLMAQITKCNVIGVDQNKMAITYAKRHYKHSRVTFIASNAVELPGDIGPINTIVSCETIEHLPETQQREFVGGLYSISDPRGKLIMSTPDRRHFSDAGIRNEHHLKELSPDELRKLMSVDGRKVTLYYQPYVPLASDKVGERTRRSVRDIMREVSPRILKDAWRILHRTLHQENPVGVGLLHWMSRHQSLIKTFEVGPYSEAVAKATAGYVFGIAELPETEADHIDLQ